MKHIVQKGLNSQNTPKLPEVKKPQVNDYYEIEKFEIDNSSRTKAIAGLLIDIVNSSRDFAENSFLKRDKFTNAALNLEQTESGRETNIWKLNPPLDFLIPDSIFITPDKFILRSKFQETGLGFKQEIKYETESDKDIIQNQLFIEQKTSKNSSENPIPNKLKELIEDNQNTNPIMLVLYNFLRNRIYEELDVR